MRGVWLILIFNVKRIWGVWFIKFQDLEGIKKYIFSTLITNNSEFQMSLNIHCFLVMIQENLNVFFLPGILLRIPALKWKVLNNSCELLIYCIYCNSTIFLSFKHYDATFENPQNLSKMLEKRFYKIFSPKKSEYDCLSKYN